jgi:pyrroline-5-carboxylate reductase
MKKLTFIGYGNMAQAMIEGAIQHYEIEVLGRNWSKLEKLQKRFPLITIKKIDTVENIDNRDIILAIKPHALKEVALQLEGKASTLYSILAGTSIKTLFTHIKSSYYVRAMPNMGASYQHSITTLTGDKEAQESATALFNTIGETLWLEGENALDIATAVAGSGPAYLALIAEALSDGAVAQGLKREEASVIVAGLFKSFAPLLDDNTPASIKDRVMSPAGTTAKGYIALEKGRVRHAMMMAVEEAYKRAKSLR